MFKNWGDQGKVTRNANSTYAPGKDKAAKA